jgi:hypothetical protein
MTALWGKLPEESNAFSKHRMTLLIVCCPAVSLLPLREWPNRATTCNAEVESII